MGRKRNWRQAVVAAWVGLLTSVLLAPDAAAAAPDLGISVSSSAGGPLKVGETFSYTIGVTNQGTATAHDVVINDDFPVGVRPTLPLPTLAGGSCTLASSQQTGAPPHMSVRCTLPSLPAGDAVTVTVAVEITKDVTCGTVTNSPTVKAGDEPGSATDDNQASVTDTVTCPPSISIVTRAPVYTHVGDLVTLSMRVTNDGATDLTDVGVRNPGCGGEIALVDDGDGNARLGPREAWGYRCSRHIPPSAAERITSTAIATARADQAHLRATDRRTVRVLRPGLTLQVTPGPASGTPGDTITYRFLLRNTGDATLTDVSIDDDQLGHVGDVARLVPGRGSAFTVERVLRARHPWVVNHATASGADPSGQTVRAADRGIVTIVAPSDTSAGASGGTHPSTAFTGPRIAMPAAAALALAVIGGSALLFPRRRRI